MEGSGAPEAWQETLPPILERNTTLEGGSDTQWGAVPSMDASIGPVEGNEGWENTKRARELLIWELAILGLLKLYNILQ